MSGPSLTDELLGGVPSILIQGKPQPNTLAANRIMAEALHEIISLRARIHETDALRESRDLSATFPDVVASWLRTKEMNPPDMRQRGQIADIIDRLWLALMMVRDADEDCKRDGLPTIPPVARSRIDTALSPLGASQDSR